MRAILESAEAMLAAHPCTCMRMRVLDGRQGEGGWGGGGDAYL